MTGAGNQGTFLVWGNDKVLLQVAQKREHKFLIGVQSQVKRHEMHPGNYPGHPPFQERTKRRRQPFDQGNTGTATNLTASTTGVYSSGGVLQGLEPPTSST